MLLRHAVFVFSCVFSTLLLFAWQNSACASDNDSMSQLAAVLHKRCVTCHGTQKQEGGYRLDTLANLLKPGDSAKVPVTAGHSERSELIARITHTNTDVRMPPEGPPLSDHEVEFLRRWIDDGAKFEQLQAEIPLIALAAPAMRRSPPEKYPASVPISAIAIDALDSVVHVWTSGYGEVLRWTLKNDGPAELTVRLPVRGTHVSKLDLSHDHRFLAVASGLPGASGQVEVFDTHQLPTSPVWTHLHGDLAGDLAFAPNANRLAIGQSDGSLLMTDFQSEPASITHSLTPHADAILCVAWSHDGKHLITGSRDRTAKVFRAPHVDLIANYDRHDRAVGGVAYLGSHPVTLDETGKMRVWTGDDNDKTIAETDTRIRFLERICADESEVWIAQGSQLRSYGLDQKTVDDGQDDQGKPKTKTVTRIKPATSYNSSLSTWALSTATNNDWLAAGFESGQVVLWKRNAAEPHGVLKAQP